MGLGLASKDEVRFRCTGCGRCCGTPPSIMIDEILRQSENFVLGAQLRIIAKIDPENPQDIKIMRGTYPELDLTDVSARKVLAEHLNRIADIQGVPIEDPISDGSSPHLAFALIDVDQLAHRCPQLGLAGQCQIYETRPRKCRAVPVDEVVPETLLGGSLRHEILRMVSAGGECEFGEDAPVIWKSGSLTRAEDQADYGANGAEMKAGAGLLSKEVIKEYLEFKAMENGQTENAMANLVEHLAVEDTRPIFALVPAVARMVKIGALPPERGANILLSQARLIEQRLPDIDPDEPIEGVWDAKMQVVLSDWRKMYLTVGQSWLRQATGG